MKRIILIVFLALAMAGCAGRSAKPKSSGASASGTEASTKQGAAPKPFPHVDIPKFLSGADEQLNYLGEHFWDKFDFADTSYVNLPDVTEQAFADYVEVLRVMPDRSAAHNSLKGLFLKSQPYPVMYEYLRDLADKYLDDPNSPMRDEELYIVVLETVIADPNIEEIMKLAPRDRLAMAQKNRVGHKATDFSFTTEQGQKRTLYGTQADYLVLFFYNLGCNACKGVRQELMYTIATNPQLAFMYASGALKIVAIYPDENMEAWDEHLGEIPAEWTNGYDAKQDINRGRLYDLRAIPSLYLLDRNKKVLVKDFVDSRELLKIVD